MIKVALCTEVLKQEISIYPDKALENLAGPPIRDNIFGSSDF